MPQLCVQTEHIRPWLRIKVIETGFGVAAEQFDIGRRHLERHIGRKRSQRLRLLDDPRTS